MCVSVCVCKSDLIGGMHRLETGEVGSSQVMSVWVVRSCSPEPKPFQDQTTESFLGDAASATTRASSDDLITIGDGPWVLTGARPLKKRIYTSIYVGAQIYTSIYSMWVLRSTLVSMWVLSIFRGCWSSGAATVSAPLPQTRT